VQQRLLAHARVEAPVAERKGGRVAPHDRDQAVEPDQAIEPRGAGGPAGVELERQNPAAASARQEARGTGQARADVENAARRGDTGPPRHVIHGLEATVVVLVELEEIVGSEPREVTAAPPGDGGEHLLLADRMAVVEVHARRLKRLATYDKSKPFSPRGGEGSPMSSEAKGGLEDVVVSTSDICFIDGREGRLVYRGYDVNDLVEHSSFEEVVYLLWHGSLPSRKELDAHVKALTATATRKLPPGLLALLRALPKKTTPMEVLRTGVSALSAFDPDATDNSREATARKAVRLTAQMPTLVAAWERIRRGKPLVAPNPKLSLAANCLAMLRGGRPTPLEVKTFDVALILHADHEFNASTFAARVTAATMSDLHSAITSAIGALKGPLHGGANEQVMRMVEEIKSPARAEAWIRKALADKARVMGFGHRVYRVEDPRAKHLRRLATELGRQAGNTSYVEILNTVARVVTEDKHIYPNVDLYSGAAYKSMGIPTDQFTPIFAISRVAGWAAHVMEQHANNRLIRPRAEYTGPTHATYVPIDRR